MALVVVVVNRAIFSNGLSRLYTRYLKETIKKTKYRRQAWPAEIGAGAPNDDRPSFEFGWNGSKWVWFGLVKSAIAPRWSYYWTARRDTGRRTRPVFIDSKSTLEPRLKTVAASAKAMLVAVLGRLMPNIGRPSASRKKLLLVVVNIRLLYAAPV